VWVIRADGILAPLRSGAHVHVPRLRGKNGACLISTLESLTWVQQSNRDCPDEPINRRHERSRDRDLSEM
jgi:hypothetical protein